MMGYIFETTIAAAQASFSVLLVLLYGYISRRYSLISEEGERNMSYLGVHVFLPALLFTQIGPQVSVSKLIEYWPLVLGAPAFMAVSLLLGWVGHKFFGMPGWIMAAAVFNNVTSLPLLLLESLEKTGTLEPLAGGGSVSDALAKGKSYILVNALVNNIMRFAFGPMLIEKGEEEDQERDEEAEGGNGRDNDDDRQPLLNGRGRSNSDISRKSHDSDRSMEASTRVKKDAMTIFQKVKASMNPPLVGGLIAVFIGCIPVLHKLFFSDDGALNPSLTQSIDKLGGLYTALQMFTLGSKLQSKRGASVPTFALIYLFAIRFLIIPALSLTAVYFLHGYWTSDLMLNFILAIGPVGPPAITLAAVVEMSGVGAAEEGRVARMLTWSYIVTPVISGPVVAALALAKNMAK
ncbi:auxin efflux carrier [Saitoella complicata NRRL Y-17804]|uniref:auxin efflux carrier n=1 Tax=Saitoella complicata (strain BCRC 22490 / CBS 7301 / JCM 7358 / NBRC 10748 / NRRL Y-17804) TaxID=698492 RepID=UPI0008673576|nr:auxin efflux carrier [Saitoella complicata NRRL Y-17804]ODQ53265.1 auxin efflux carrier [Saitoella complicata NRRL Y-17804]